MSTTDKPTVNSPAPSTKTSGLNTPTVNKPGNYNAAHTPVGKTSIPRYSTSYDRPDLGATQNVVNTVYQNLMGRNATAYEIQGYHQQYLQYASSHPSSSGSSIANVDPTTGQEISTTSTSTSGGMNERDFVNNLVQGNAEFQDYQKATTYFDAMRSAMNSFGGGY